MIWLVGMKANSDKFMVDKTSGMVNLTSKIDRESLENSYFDLVIKATEVEEPSSSSLLNTTIFIDDINDNWPEFNKTEYVYSVSEDFKGAFFENDIIISDPDLVRIFNSFGSHTMYYKRMT